MTPQQIAETLIDCEELISYDEEESLIALVSELKSALSVTDIGHGWKLDGDKLSLATLEVRSDSILIFEDESDLYNEEVAYLTDSMENDSGFVNPEEAAEEGYLNKSNSEVRDEWIAGEIEHYQNHKDDAINNHIELYDKQQAFESKIDELQDRVDDLDSILGDLSIEIKYLKKIRLKTRVKPSRKAHSMGEKLGSLLAADDSALVRQGQTLVEGLVELDDEASDYEQQVVDTIETLNSAYDVVDTEKGEFDSELSDAEQELKDWLRMDIYDEIAELVKDEVRSNIDISYHGDMYAFLTMEIGFESQHVIDNYFEGIDYGEYAKWLVGNEQAGRFLDGYDGESHEDCGLIWVHH